MLFLSERLSDHDVHPGRRSKTGHVEGEINAAHDARQHLAADFRLDPRHRFEQLQVAARRTEAGLQLDRPPDQPQRDVVASGFVFDQAEHVRGVEVRWICGEHAAIPLRGLNEVPVFLIA